MKGKDISMGPLAINQDANSVVDVLEQLLGILKELEKIPRNVSFLKPEKRNMKKMLRCTHFVCSV